MQYIDCNINPISRVVSYPGATIVQRDTNVEALRFHFSLDAEYELENDSIRIMVLKDGKTNGFNAENVRVETNDGGDEELVFEHTITTHETATPGQIAISVCGNQVSGNNITEAWHTLNMVFQVASAAHSESDEGEDTPETIASNAEKIAALQTLVDAITSGRPIPVDLKSKMTDTSAIYLYTGNETGEQHNYWYYHDGTSWVPGSEYGGMTIDDELSSTSENAVQNKVIKANFDEINGRLGQLDKTVYTTGQECELRKTTTGYALDTNGYRVAAEGYKLFSFRVAPGWLIKVASTHKFQFQSNVDVTTSGTQYKIGPTYGEGEYVLTVPEGASYVVVSSASESETVYRVVSAITQAYNEVNAKAEDAQTKADYSLGNLRLVNNELFPYGDNSTVTSEMSGYGLDADGYRITQDGNKLMRFRVFAGNIIKFACPDKCQFQSTDGVTTSGTQYKIGPTYGIGEYVFEVPDGATYLIISTPSDNNVTVARVDHFVDETLSKEWKAADARQTGNGIDDTKTYLAEIGSYMYTNVRELTSVKTLTGYALNDKGYRVVDENRKLESIRCFEGTYVKVKSDHMFQFQSSRDVTTSGTQYKFGRTYGTGEYVLKVPEGASYVILSTAIEDSTATVHEVTSNIDSATAKIGETASSVESMKDNLIGPLLNAYTSQVSDVPYVEEPAVITIGIDTSVPQFISGTGKALVVPIIGGTSIRVAKPQTDHCLVCFTSDYPAANVAVTHYTSLTSRVNTSFVAESQASDKYLVIYTHATTPDIADYTLAFSQVARGTVELLPQLDKHMVNLLKYRPVGKISKPYIAISCDDGLEPLATYTIPRIQYWNNQYNTNIPLHMALFDGSPVLTNSEYAALVTDMCVNHNCSIGVHGTQSYTAYSSSTTLYAYLKKQYDTIVNVTGVTPTSVLYPQGDYTDEIMVMCGGFCGICAMGGDVPPTYKYTDESGRYFYVGEKTNLYELNRFNISDTRINSPEELKRVIDYAFDHNLTLCPYFHDIDFTEHTEAANQFARTMFDTLIQYGMEKGIEFINLGDIRFLT